MSAATKWAIGAGFAIVAVAIGGAAAWRQQHPDGALRLDLASILPKIPRLDPMQMDTPVRPAKPAEAGADGQPAALFASNPGMEKKKPDDSITPGVPHFDVARVEPAGDAVIAGSGAPNARVALLAGGKVLAETRSDANGQFVLLPSPLAPGDQSLSLRQSPDGKAAVESTQKLVLSVPGSGKGQVVIALAEPGKATRMLSGPATSAAAPALVAATPAIPKSTPAPASPQRLAIQSTVIGKGNGFDATGVAAPGTPVHLYLNDSHLADVVAGRDGNWRVVIRKDLAGGHYSVRAETASSGSQVAGRVEVPFDVPFAAAAAATSVSPADSRAIPSRQTDVASGDAPSMDAASGDTLPEPNESAKTVSSSVGKSPAPAISASPDPAHAVINAIETRKVFGGDNLWRISRERLGEGTRFSQIYAANANQIRDPNLIYPGQIFVLPRK